LSIKGEKRAKAGGATAGNKKICLAFIGASEQVGKNFNSAY
jgi:hypothetical protein